MAGQHLSGDDGGAGLNEPVFPALVDIRTPNFTATALPLYAMPGVQVMEAMSSDDLQQKMWMMFQLFVVSLNGEKAVEDLGVIDYHELNLAVAQWINKSNLLQMQGATDSGVRISVDLDEEGESEVD